MRSTSNEVPDGRLGRILFTCDWHCSIAEIMSSPQLKLTEISEVPRLVVDLKLRTPGIADRKLDQRMRIGGETVGNHRKHGWIHALDFERSAGRQARENFVYLRLALQHCRDHVFAPIEVDRDLRSAATGCRS